jgi:uncharacterized protein YqeY
VLAAMKNRRIELREDLDEAQELAVLMQSVKSRKDSAEQYQDAGRSELADKELAEIRIIDGYLPQQLTEEETREIVGAMVTELGLTSKKELGALMKQVMARHKGRVDGKLVQRFAAELLD